MKYETYNNYNESNIDWIGLMPAEWNLIRLKFLADIVTGSTPSKNDDTYYKEGTFPWVKPDDLKGLTPIMNTNVLINEEGKRVSRIVPKNSILVCCIGSLGKIGISGTELATNQQINSLIPNNLLNNNFCKYMVIASSSEYDKFSNSNVVAIINKQQQGELNYPIPPLTEQKQIATYLDKKTAKIDETISKNKQLIDLLEEKRVALINQVVTKGLNPEVPMEDSEIEWIGEIPEHWNEIKLKDISIKIGDGLHSTPKYEEDTNYYFINGNNLENGKIKFFENTMEVPKEEFKKYKINLNKQSILISLNGTIGNLSFFNGEKVILGKSAGYINLINNVNKYYIFYQLQSCNIMSYFHRELSGTTIKNLSLETLKHTKLSLPPLEEQKQIADYLLKNISKINKTIKKVNENIALLEEYNTSLIHHVVTGKIDVRGEEI